VTPAEPNEIATPTDSAAPDAVVAVPTKRRRWPWLIVLTLTLAAVLGMAVGVSIVLRGRSFGTAPPSETAARPTFVVVAAASPSPSGSPRPVAVPTITASDAYIVQAGDTLRSIAQQAYGDAAQWPRIYDANRDTIGPDPDALEAGMRLRIP
jgi:nucleoid-associated protein YgaU